MPALMGKLIERLKSTSLVKKLVHLVVGICTYPGIAIFNKLRIKGSDKVKALPKTNVLFVCNHQTYFLDVITMFHIFRLLNGVKKIGWAYLFIC
ncbi:lysophospholipid acyltransferase family protein [Niabella hibiscisoli]|uniref:1-acyl-sn-glycerol-3-phosphate acyltransferase n=1 Tax=Niabella hibiscisoli TaxID=1825928 RepID=UPI001F113093|nr:1-acyl-sn-glycerol-3-phosphate acyltransferase [Niabella hibiscisoli]MCH5721391.1 1-acyl-sn-glycerol-3-phosphate acyltransferase [Niabella hibiscisoli]